MDTHFLRHTEPPAIWQPDTYWGGSPSRRHWHADRTIHSLNWGNPTKVHKLRRARKGIHAPVHGAGDGPNACAMTEGTYRYMHVHTANAEGDTNNEESKVCLTPERASNVRSSLSEKPDRRDKVFVT